MNKKIVLIVAFAVVIMAVVFTLAVRWFWEDEGWPARARVQIGGVFPDMAIVSEHVPRTEAGIGALIPWADRLWVIGYVAHIKGSGLGLYEIDEKMVMRRRPEGVTGTFANRMVHNPSNQAIIGPHIIDTRGHVRTFKALAGHRLTATMDHLTDPENKVYFLTMEGLFFEADVHTLRVKQLYDLVKELELPEGAQPHFKGGYCDQGRVVVANNTYDELEFEGKRAAGRLAEWDGKAWTILDRNPYVEVSGKKQPVYGSPIMATGWDKASVILKVFINGVWTTYRLPKAGQTFDHTWNTEWMRIREAQTERFLMDVHGMFYEVPVLFYKGRIWGIRPIAAHLRLVPDFCCWRGLLVLGGDQTEAAIGQPQSGLWFGNIDDLWKWGKPGGWGGPWWETEVKAGVPSDPYLMTGFDKKVLHLSHEADTPVDFKIEVDFLGDGSWKTYATFTVPAHSYVHHEFPDGFSAHWVRVMVNKDCGASAYFFYN
jgi:hypothetical protein